MLVADREQLVLKAAGDIRPGDWMAVGFGTNAISQESVLPPAPDSAGKRRLARVPAMMTEDLAGVMGYLLGDGSLPRDGRAAVHFAVDDRTEPELRTRLERCFGYSGVSSAHAQTNKCRNLWVYSRDVRNVFERMVGVDPADKLHVPLAIRRSPKNVVSAFLAGLWAADGYWPHTGHHPYLVTSSKGFAEEGAALALWNGQGARVSEVPKPPKGKGPSYRVSICQASCREQRKGRICWTAGVPVERLRRRDHSRRPYGGRRRMPRVLLAEREPGHELLRDGFLYVQVVGTQDAGVRDVYDMSVCPEHRFSAACAIVHNCSFCSSASIRERKWRAMSVERVLDDLKEAIARFRLDGWWWRDDEFYIKRTRAHAIMEGIVAAGIDGSFYTSGTRCDVFGKATEDEVAVMKKAGAHTLKFGAESGSQRILDLMQKGITVEQTLEANQKCQRHGITPAFALMIGYPTETFEEIDQTIDLGYRLKRENPHAELETMAQYTALPGTPDWHLALKHGLQPPASLEEWAGWVFDEFDLDGVKSPWYPRRERRWLGNISYLSILANSLDNVVTSLRNPWVRWPAKALVKPASKYFKWRLSTHRYRTLPELEVVRILREKIFYRSTMTFE